MKGLIQKDLLILGDSARIVMVLIFFCFFAIVFQMEVALLTSMISLMLVTTSISTFSYDDLAHWDVFAMTFPCGRKMIVQAKYCLTILMILVAMLLCFTFNLVPILFGSTVQVEEVAIICFGAIGLSGLLDMVLIPLIFKYGAEKSRMMMIILIVIIYAVGFGAVGVINELQLSIAITSPMLLAVMTLFVVVGTLISYCCSLQIMKKKEF